MHTSSAGLVIADYANPLFSAATEFEVFTLDANLKRVQRFGEVPEVIWVYGPGRIDFPGDAVFEFESEAPLATFQCRLDGGRFRPCSSPTTVEAGLGKHKMTVRAIVPPGIKGPPKTYRWKNALLGGVRFFPNSSGALVIISDPPCPPSSEVTATNNCPGVVRGVLNSSGIRGRGSVTIIEPQPYSIDPEHPKLRLELVADAKRLIPKEGKAKIVITQDPAIGETLSYKVGVTR